MDLDPTEAESCDKDHENESDFEVYNHVCLGGTFDRIHLGHKILLTQAALRCKSKLTVGVTDQAMLQSKKLSELIQPVEIRMQKVQEFLDQIRANENFVTAISDPFGPAITDESIECIVASQETKRGCDKINQIRAEKNFKPLDVFLIDLVQDSAHELTQLEETKIR